MTNPPSGSSGSTGSSGGTDFGATTLSGRPDANRGDAAGETSANRSAPTDRDPANRPIGGDTPSARPTDRSTPLVTGSAAPSQTQTTGLGPLAPQPGTPGRPGDTSETSAVRGIRTGRARGPRRARLQIRHINPVTVLKFSCVLAVALFFVWLIIVGVLFGILDAAGVVGHINDLVTQLNGAGSKAPVTAGIVFGGAAIIGVINIVLFIALSTIGAVIYNLCADLVGGIEITLSER